VETKLNVKAAILASAISLALGISAAHAAGDATTQSNDTSATNGQSSGSMTGKQKATAIGAGTGAVAGAVVGGPVGAVVGAGIGGFVGHEGTDANGRTSASGAGSSDSTVRKAQAALTDKGYTLAVDGRYGPNTQSAVRSFQEKNGLTATGSLDSPTLSALGAN
jgi:hypothetical protein